MIPIPAIDLKEGRVVRLFQGKFKEESVYAEKPENIARTFESEGALRIHVVDLDGALKGEPKNLGAIERILKNVKTPIEVGGGIRDLKTVEKYLALGITWTVLGTKACLDKGFMREAVTAFKDRVIIGIDALNGLVATDGWTKVTKMPAVQLAQDALASGVRSIIYTDISKDGAMAGPNTDQVRSLCDAVKIEVIASGGISSVEDLKKLLSLNCDNLKGVIIGKALYEKKLTLAQATAALSSTAGPHAH